MISPDHIRLMAVYNKWQNESLLGAADGLSEMERRLDRGAFFRSIHETLNHILWADQIWMSRLAGTPAPKAPGIPASVSQIDGWDALKAARVDFDRQMIDWSRTVSPADLEGDLSWYSGAAKREISKARWVLITHMFNHGTHHRGQVHAMLTAAGAKPDDTDIPFMPQAYSDMLKQA
ncbi:DinB family protein [Aquisalinus flavus]|uniref:Damage-inducible protein DinB n=1 Tax=Aquisalinus flavus TaxID=1526572 RepID=A0A8J2Y674_9PROT|nr:DinB family protein [Aquisalinus flavus]MBD0426620.1 DinB family protein [Aquisalinus flavus]UNE47836.1 DUF664 domain-containing protein [Aquisalinus flavus]GGD06425.1 damage-inducible protein DinB [Aquisalinus flavus]